MTKTILSQLRYMAAIAALALLAIGCVTVPSPADQAREELFTLLRTSTMWQRIHAAEELCRSGILSAETTAIYEAEYAASEPRTPYRIGCIRVLYRNCPEKRQELRAELLDNALDSNGGATTHAVETTGKLGIVLTPAEAAVFTGYLQRQDPVGAYAILPLVVSGTPGALELWNQRMARCDGTAVALGSYLDEIPAGCRPAYAAARHASGGTEAFQTLAFQAYLRHCDIENADYHELWRRVSQCSDGMRRYYLQSVGDIGGEKDLQKLLPYLKDSDPENRIAAAGAILRITTRCSMINKPPR